MPLHNSSRNQGIESPKYLSSNARLRFLLHFLPRDKQLVRAETRPLPRKQTKSTKVEISDLPCVKPRGICRRRLKVSLIAETESDGGCLQQQHVYNLLCIAYGTAYSSQRVVVRVSAHFEILKQQALFYTLKQLTQD